MITVFPDEVKEKCNKLFDSFSREEKVLAAVIMRAMMEFAPFNSKDPKKRLRAVEILEQLLPLLKETANMRVINRPNNRQ